VHLRKSAHVAAFSGLMSELVGETARLAVHAVNATVWVASHLVVVLVHERVSAWLDEW
jgi:hypothetical protein